jgi:hypothetical protein
MKNRNGDDLGESLLASMRADGIKPSKAALHLAKLFSEEDFTREELQEIYDYVTMHMLLNGSPEDRREVLATMDACPCCNRWLGHNKPPADDDDVPPFRRQSSFDFER